MRIVSLAPSNTEILFALNAGDQVVACTAYCDYPQKARKLPKVGGWTTISNELIRKYKPDLILTSTVVQKDAKKRFAKEKFRVEHINVVTLDGIYDSILRIGELVGKQEEAQKLVDKMKARLLNIKPNTHGLRVYVEEWADPPMASGNWVIDLIRVAGGVPLLAKGEISKGVTRQEVEKFDPDLIVLAYCGYGNHSDPLIVKKRWPGLRAVKKDKVFVVDEGILNRPGPRIWHAARDLAKICASL